MLQNRLAQQQYVVGRQRVGRRSSPQTIPSCLGSCAVLWTRVCWCWDEAQTRSCRRGINSRLTAEGWVCASGSELLCFSSFAFHLELRTAECLCHLILVSVCVVTNRTKNHDRIAYVWQKKDLSDFGCFHFLFKINFFCSGVGATISDAVARSSIVLCNSVSADRIVIAASRLLRAVAAFVILLSFAAGSRKSSWSGYMKAAK